MYNLHAVKYTAGQNNSTFVIMGEESRNHPKSNYYGVAKGRKPGYVHLGRSATSKLTASVASVSRDSKNLSTVLPL